MELLGSVLFLLKMLAFNPINQENYMNVIKQKLVQIWKYNLKLTNLLLKLNYKSTIQKFAFTNWISEYVTY